MFAAKFSNCPMCRYARIPCSISASAFLNAWTGTDRAHQLNVGSSPDRVAFGNVVTIAQTSAAGPALASFDRSLDIAWTAHLWTCYEVLKKLQAATIDGVPTAVRREKAGIFSGYDSRLDNCCCLTQRYSVMSPLIARYWTDLERTALVVARGQYGGDGWPAIGLRSHRVISQVSCKVRGSRHASYSRGRCRSCGRPGGLHARH